MFQTFPFSQGQSFPTAPSLPSAPQVSGSIPPQGQPGEALEVLTQPNPEYCRSRVCVALRTAPLLSRMQCMIRAVSTDSRETGINRVRRPTIATNTKGARPGSTSRTRTSSSTRTELSKVRSTADGESDLRIHAIFPTCRLQYLVQ